MLLLISDANILIDMEAGRLLEALFLLPMTFAMSDVVYREEIEPGTPGLERLGLKLLELTGASVDYASRLPLRHGHRPSIYDFFSLALARQEGCPLLTGDQDLRQVAVAEGVPVMGTVWVLGEMRRHGVLDAHQALAALALMKAAKRRLPWAEAERALGPRGSQN